MTKTKSAAKAERRKAAAKEERRARSAHAQGQPYESTRFRSPGHSHAQARAEVDEMIAAGIIDPANVYDDGHTIRISSGWDFSPELSQAMAGGHD